MKITRLAQWNNALKDQLYQSNYDEAYDTLLEEVDHLSKTKKENK